MVLKSLFITVFVSVAAGVAYGQTAAVQKKILAQGVPADAFQRLKKFLNNNQGRTYTIDTYTCDGRDEDSVRPCEEAKRNRSSKRITVVNPQYVAIVDFTAPSTKRRFYLINLRTGAVDKFYTAHGIGSGKSNYAVAFSNTKDSRQTSLGFYVAGEVYTGHYGDTLRMYGLQRSNDEAYNRDIVLHGAWYVGEDFINSIDPKTGKARGRLGVSWGCPAVSMSVAQKIIPLLKGGSLIYHYHADLDDASLSGAEVSLR